MTVLGMTVTLRVTTSSDYSDTTGEYNDMTSDDSDTTTDYYYWLH